MDLETLTLEDDSIHEGETANRTAAEIIIIVN
jgi:hypothetical protein